MKLEISMEKSSEMWRAVDAVNRLEELRKNINIYFLSIELEIGKKYYEIQMWPKDDSPHRVDNGYGESAAYVASGDTLWEAVDKAWEIVEGWTI